MDERAKESARSTGRMRRERRLEFPDQLMFRKVMEADNGVCERFLERVLGFPIERIERKSVEDEQNPTLASRGVRLDVFVKGSNKMIDLEMQASEPYALGKRMRYYQAAMDVNELSHGQDVESLPESYIVFVCRRDPFSFAIPRYTMRQSCAEAPEVELHEEMRWLVLNASAFAREEDPGMRAVLEYVSCGTITRDDPLIGMIEREVARINEFDEEVKVFWTLEDEFKLQTKHKVQEAVEAAVEKAVRETEQRAFAEGSAEGEAIGETRLSELMGILLDADRIDDAKRATADPAYRDELFEELGIV